MEELGTGLDVEVGTEEGISNGGAIAGIGREEVSIDGKG